MIAALLEGLTQFFLPTHLLAVGAIGLLGRQGARAAMLALFALGLAAGALVIASAVRETPAATALLAIAAFAGSIVVFGRTPPRWLAATLSFAAGGAIALNSPPQALTIPAAVAMQIGTAIAAFATLALIASIAAGAQRSWQRIGARVLGSWIVASAILVLALRLAGLFGRGG
jgi:hypothetical protein